MMKNLILILIVFLLSVTICSAKSVTISSASDPWPPFVDPDHPKMGISLEIVSAAYETQGFEIKHKLTPWARAEEDVKNGKTDIIPNTWKTDKRLKYLMYSKPYAFNEVKFIKKKGDPFEYDGLKSLTGKKIGIMRGYGYGDDFSNATNFKREAVDDFTLSIKKLVAKRIDLTLEDEIVASSLILKKDPKLLEEIEFTNNFLSSQGLHVTCGLKNPRHEEFINAFDKGLEEIKSNGTLKKIFISYGLK